MAMKNISFDDGYKSFTLNGDKNRVIRFNPSDINLIKRAKEAEERINPFLTVLDDVKLNADGTPVNADDEIVRVINEFENAMRDQLNYIFNSDIYDTVFAGQSPLCIVGKDKIYLFEAFMDSVMPVMMSEIEGLNAASQARVSKYTKGY